MTDSLRDQLLGLGFKPAPKQKPAQPGKHPPKDKGKPRHAGKGKDARPPRTREDIDLAKAYAIRAQREKDERIEAERRKQEEARQRREAREKLTAFLQGKALNAEDAEIARHFDYGGKIKRIYVTADQLQALNSGELGVVQLNGRYLLVTAAVLAEAEAIFAQAVALKIDPDAPPQDDPYTDPRFQVPDDLVW
ncbi:MAG: DUF2058 family protein [Luteimonas sp.]|nr:DUF2058 family protein [Luteimonas sp.]